MSLLMVLILSVSPNEGRMTLLIMEEKYILVHFLNCIKFLFFCKTQTFIPAKIHAIRYTIYNVAYQLYIYYGV